MSIEQQKTKLGHAVHQAARPAEWGIALSAGAAIADNAAMQGGPVWLPIVTGILSLIIRLLPMFMK